MDRKSHKTNKQDVFGLRNMVCGLGILNHLASGGGGGRRRGRGGEKGELRDGQNGRRRRAAMTTRKRGRWQLLKIHSHERALTENEGPFNFASQPSKVQVEWGFEGSAFKFF
jgi:hypothetical protein